MPAWLTVRGSFKWVYTQFGTLDSCWVLPLELRRRPPEVGAMGVRTLNRLRTNGKHPY